MGVIWSDNKATSFLSFHYIPKSFIMINLPICYRCQETISDSAEPINCCQCYKYWHSSCLIFPVDTNSLKDWKCPQHDGRSYVTLLQPFHITTLYLYLV